MNARALWAMVLAFVFPGAGHVFLGRRALGAAFCLIVVTMFAMGLFIGGDLYSLSGSHGDVLRTLATAGSMGTGLLYFVTLHFAPFGDIRNATFEYGTTFTLTAGLMNLLLILDCFDRAHERKSS